MEGETVLWSKFIPCEGISNTSQLKGGMSGGSRALLRASCLAARMDEHSGLRYTFYVLTGLRLMQNMWSTPMVAQRMGNVCPLLLSGYLVESRLTTVKSAGFSGLLPTVTGKNPAENSEELLRLTWDPSFLPGTESWPWMTISQGSLEK